jgi:tetratricopeptide (TPR) repeat protein
MERRLFRSFRLLPALLFVLPVCGSVFAQTSSGPINLDRALRDEAPQEPSLSDSYYHYALAKLHENDGNITEALSEMQLALDANPTSSAIHYEQAFLYARLQNIQEAIRCANASVRLDPENPDPHWLLANIYLSPQPQPRGGLGLNRNDGIRQAVKELEILEKLTPEDERVYFMLGGVYFNLGEIDWGIAAYEKFQKYADSDDGYREISRYYAGIGNLNMAIEYLVKGLEYYPDSAESMVTLGNIYLSQGRNKEAAEVLKKLFHIPGSGDVRQIMRQLAVILFDAKNYREAADILEELEKSVGPERLSQVILGQSYFNLNRYSDAIRLFREVLSRVPEDMEARFYLGESYLRRGRYEDAAKIFEDLLQDRENREAVNNRGLFMDRLAGIWIRLENYEKAIDMYEKIAEANPKDRFKLLEAYRVGKQYDKGLALGKEFLAKNPDDVDVGIIYARTLADAGKKKDGVDFLSRLLLAHPDDIQIYINLGEIHRQDKRWADAEKVLLQGEQQKMNPEAIEQLKFQRAAIYEQQKSYDRAEKMFRELLEARPGNATVLNYLGYMLADRGVRLDEAVRYVREALEIDPENGAFLDSLGWAYFRLNDMENAEKYLVESVGIVPGDSTVHDHLGDLYFKLGQLEKARDYWTAAARISEDTEEVQRVRRKLGQVEDALRKKSPSRK